MTNKTDGERLERVETNIENLSKLFEKAFDEFSKDLKDIKETQIKTLATNASKEYVDGQIAEARTDFTVALADQKRKNALQVWITGSLSALFGAILTLLITYFITNISQ